jgi:hypothetical protein
MSKRTRVAFDPTQSKGRGTIRAPATPTAAIPGRFHFTRTIYQH